MPTNQAANLLVSKTDDNIKPEKQQEIFLKQYFDEKKADECTLQCYQPLLKLVLLGTNNGDLQSSNSPWLPCTS